MKNQNKITKMQQMIREKKHLKRTWLLACDLFDQVIWTSTNRIHPFLYNLDSIGLDNRTETRFQPTPQFPKLQIIEN